MVLNNYDDQQWLGENSPLAAPYFLGAALIDVPDAHSAVGRGRTLQQVISQAADSLWDGPLPASQEELEATVQAARQEQGNSGNRYYFFLLDLRYLRRIFRPRAHPPADNEQAIRDYLGVGRGPYFNHLKAAREALGEAVITLLQPTFRLERPPQLVEGLVGREALVADCWRELQAAQTVAVTGMGGVGKTALGTAIAQKWRQSPLFWFTFRPMLTDQLSSLLFSLGYFLHQCGASGLWLQLVADNGKIENLHLALEQVRGDLHKLEPQPLLCIDEVEHLITPAERITPDQQQLQAFLESLRGLVPLLLIGQQVHLLADAHHEVSGFTLEQMTKVLAQSGVAYEADEAERLQRYTGGNVRMLWLVVALCQSGRSLIDVLNGLPETAVFQALFTRLWQALSLEEQELLRLVAVFRGPAPEDALPQATTIVASLAARHILQRDGHGAIMLLPILRDLIYDDHQRLSAEEREQAHLMAANIRAERGEYTAAAYHFVRGGEASAAVYVWYPHRQQEIKRGQADPALAIFERLSGRRLSEEAAQALALLRAELYQLRGETEPGLAELKAVNWQMESETAVQAHLLQGAFLNALGYPHLALEKLADGVTTIARMMTQLVRFRQQRSLIHIQQWQMPDAVQEARLARYTAEHLQGLIQEQQGNYDAAYLAYHQALALARSVSDEAGVAQTSRSLANILLRQSRLDEARSCLQVALDYYEVIGDRLSWEKARSTLAGIHFQAKEFEQVITIGEASLPFFERAKIPYYASVTTANLAESYYEIGDLAQAEYYVHKTLSLEETHAYPYALYTLGLVKRAQKRYAEAEKALQQAQMVAADNADSYMEAYAWRLLAEVLAVQNKQESARHIAQQALNQFERLNIQAEIKKTQTLLASLT